MKAVVFTLGCKVNSYESQSLIRLFSKLGYETSEKLEFANVYVINTCAVTSEAEKKSRQAIARVKSKNPNAKIIVTGCASQKNPTSFLEKDGVTLVTGTQYKQKIIELLNESGNKVFDFEPCYEDMEVPLTCKVRSFIKVQDGCNNFCSYCIIPYLRGRSRSRSIESILCEIDTVKPLEAVLTAINLSAYNFENNRLSNLISALSSVKSRIRLGSLEENVINADFLSACKNLYDFAPHFHLSLQSGSTKTLKSMNRKYTAEEFEKGINLIRSVFPNAGITTDIIVGYPTETEEDFNTSYEFAKRVKFSDIHAFPFSMREGTNAYKLKDLPDSVKKERLNKMLDLKQNLKSEFINNNLGLEHQVIFEEEYKGYMTGYTGNYIKTYVKGSFEPKKLNVILKEPYLDGALGIIKE
ncbi:MAG: tRNA (N(6)-L-threonylcarbamoyladenosine(37)-C(2))-methylthiotransferase MtaB [Clostridia bacterium]|nr:tRNA (N(6)-L-threonylcarbamoyladenosine(37)-C(2))-methylthiotransferase MtaB [Clostridia bacterium]